MGKYKGISLFSLIVQCVKLGVKWFALEKEYAVLEVKNLSGKGLPSIIMAIVGIAILAIAVVFAVLAGAVLIMNIWFATWLSVIIVAAILIAVGLILALTGGLKARNCVKTAKTSICRIKEDMLWLKQS